MARKPFKRFVTKYLYSWEMERSVYVLVSSVSLHLLFRYWTPMSDVIFEFPSHLHTFITLLPVFGYVIVMIASMNIDHFQLFGVKQSMGIFPTWRGLRVIDVAAFVKVGLYNYVRHPLMTGFFIAFWPAPVFTYGRLLFAVMTSCFIVFTVFLFEEADLEQDLGEPYSEYLRTTPAFFPIPFLSSSPGKKKEH